MKIIKIILSVVIMIILIISAFILGEKRGSQSVYDMVESPNEAEGQDIYSKLAAQGIDDDCELTSSAYWYECENNDKCDVVAFGVLSSVYDDKLKPPNDSGNNIESQEKSVQYGFLIDSAGKVYCGDYSDKEWGYEVNYALLSRENIQCVGDFDEELLVRIMAVTSDWNNYGVAIKKDYDYTGCDFRICIVKHNEESVVEGITLYEAEKSYYKEDKLCVTHNANSVLNDIGRDLFDYFAKIYSDKAEKDYNYIIESEIR